MSQAITRVEIVQSKLENYLASAAAAKQSLPSTAQLSPDNSLTVQQAREIFADQVTSRLLDVAARELKKRNLGFYTISSAGHEQNAIVGALLRLDDPCFLHYRAGAMFVARSRKFPGATPIRDILLSFIASKDDQIAEGRHKVWGSRPLWIPPQTSTIASHLPKAAGLAFSLRQARKLGRRPALDTEQYPPLRDDSIVCCSFGDASANHATALSGINAARYTVRRGGASPIIFVCEDNGIGISVETPRDWIRDSFSNQPHLAYYEADGEIDTVWETAKTAIDFCRRKRHPVFLHLRTARLWGHAGTDVETTYRTVEEIEAAEARDPLLRNARRLIETGAATPDELLTMMHEIQARIDAEMADLEGRPKLATVAEVIRPLAPEDEEKWRAVAQIQAPPSARADYFGSILPEQATAPTKRTMGAQINSALADEMLRFPEIIAFGEDVGKKGGVYYVTAGLQKKFGAARCFDTLLDETTIFGVAQGAAMAGLLPIPEIQYLAYIHNALDQLRGEACSLSFFSAGQFTNPMVVRVAGLAYQKGFGGHFHNDNSIGALRDIPGLALAVPSRGDDAARMLRGAIAMARSSGRVVAFLEPIALYHEKDLYDDGDGKWLFDYPAPSEMLLPGEVGVYHPDARDLLIISYANGLRLSLRAARTLDEKFGLKARVLDLRWLNPLPFEAIREQAADCSRVLVADECRATGGGIADAVIASLAESGFRGRLGSVRAVDTYVPLGPPANLVLISDEQIVNSARHLCER
jgi:2-oxoisovalerate dehydrogenase E1 component